MLSNRILFLSLLFHTWFQLPGPPSTGPGSRGAAGAHPEVVTAAQNAVPIGNPREPHWAALCQTGLEDECALVWAATELLPDMVTLPPADLRLVQDAGRERRWIRFSNTVANLGPGPLELRGVYNWRTDTVQVTQAVYRNGGSYRPWGLGEFFLDPQHRHWHWEAFSSYEVWSVTPEGALVSRVSASHKVGYCLLDDDPLPDDAADGLSVAAGDVPERSAYLGCGWSRQGISAGWMDTYRRTLPRQYVDVSGLPDGVYALKSTVDPVGRLRELDKTNNAGVVYFALEGDQIEVFGEALRSPGE